MVISRLPYHEGELEREEEKRDIFSQANSIATEKDREIAELLQKVQLEKEMNTKLTSQVNSQRERELQRQLEQQR